MIDSSSRSLFQRLPNHALTVITASTPDKQKTQYHRLIHSFPVSM
ncbi:hypothetical protein CA85_28180 [Allorhodopirellula solitaria]|uniref:Uncharacterized protein n=1 Tax=Allorhodopirellula solitaria TaxID=2527987 RepID=A0A5C5XTQ3_9BACT|nr:hypothetical protein CA85_28180 [Allorhodopirellula solitaria]